MATDRFNERKLREESLKAFVKALHTDRMVAVTGAMSTRALGYPSWGEFTKAYAAVACTLAEEICTARSPEPGFGASDSNQLLNDIQSRAKALEQHHGSDLDPRVAIWTLHDSFRQLDEQLRLSRAGLVINNKYQRSALKRFEKRVAAIFTSRTFGPSPLSEKAQAAIRPLIASLGIKRVATLNYDLELERAFMLRGDERDLVADAENEAAQRRSAIAMPKMTRAKVFAVKACEPLQPMSSVKHFIGKESSGKPIVKAHRRRLSRTMSNGIHVESDIVDRERPDRLFEFAVGSAEIGRHILHLHGRADVPETMVANIRQYDRLYRLDDLYRDPFDHSLRVLFGGNPILFVGIGMTEAELNRTLEYFVSNVPVRRPAPTFVIWNTVDITDPAERKAFMRKRRLDFRTRLGVHVLFDEDIVQPGDTWLKRLRKQVPAKAPAQPDLDSSVTTLRALLAAIAAANEQQVAPDMALLQQHADALASLPERIGAKHDDPALEAVKLQAMAEMLENLPKLVSRIDQRVGRQGKWRSIDARLSDSEPGKNAAGPFRLWGATGLMALGAKQRFQLDKLATPKGDAPTDSRDTIIFAAAPVGYGRGELAENLLQMEDLQAAAIGEIVLTETCKHNRLLVNAGFSYDSDAMLTGIARFLRERAEEKPQPESQRCREKYFANSDLFKTHAPALVIINGADRFFGFDGTPLSAELDHLLRCAKTATAPEYQVQFLLLGTQRLRHYCELIDVPLQRLPAEAKPRPSSEPLADPGVGLEGRTQVEKLALAGKLLRSSYLEHVADSFRKRRRVRYAEISRRAKGHAARQPAALANLDISDAAAAHLGRAINVDREALNRAFYEAFLSPTLLKALGVDCPAAFEVLRTMCFIGAPVEGAVLLHAPKVRAILAERSKHVNADIPAQKKLGTDMEDAQRIRQKLKRVLALLRDLGLLIELEPHQPYDITLTNPASNQGRKIRKSGYRTALKANPLWSRFGLHRSLATLLRDRHGAPINDAKLATTFNMSLFMSEPSDNTTPEPDFHDELGDLVDHLIGGWHDIERIYGPGGYALPDDATKVKYRAALQQIHIHPEDEEHARKTLIFRSSREAAACLRAALSLVRGYYSTGALLKIDRGDRAASAERDGALTEHAHRFDRLITGFGDNAVARSIVREMFAAKIAEGKATLADERRHMGSEPFYEDDLVWLLNERSVVALAQGHLFDAREAGSAAYAANHELVEHEYHGHNWRRISINLVATRIERGTLKPAERLLDDIESTINDAPWAAPRTPEVQRRADEIRAMFRASPSPPIRGNAHYSREEMLVTGMTAGYRGLIAHMRGRYHDAKEAYEDAIVILRRLGEQRAVAHFERHFASLQGFMGDRKAAGREIDFAIAAAQSAKQMDILHRARVVRADLLRTSSIDPTTRRKAIQDIKDALKYAALSDSYRVRIEASASLARHMRYGGDYDTALRYATDALTIASRYGHSLQKTSLRIEIGQILRARGDPISGDALLEQAIAIGTSKGYHQALERVRRARNSHAAQGPLPNRTDVPVSG